MAEKKAAAGTNKSEEIRKLARSMKEKGEKPRPVVIVATLKKHGIDVAPAQVSIVLKKMGFRPRKRRSSAAVAKAAAAFRADGHAGVSIEDLITAKKIVGQLGGTDRALAAIAALKRFES